MYNFCFSIILPLTIKMTMQKHLQQVYFKIITCMFEFALFIFKLKLSFSDLMITGVGRVSNNILFITCIHHRVVHQCKRPFDWFINLTFTLPTFFLSVNIPHTNIATDL